MRRYLYIAVFSSGLVTMAAEMAASRLLGNVFGSSNLVWASIIGLILIYLTAGYFLGGRLADDRPQAKTLFSVMLWGGFTVGVVPLVSRPILKVAATAFDNLQMGDLVGSFVVVMVLFIIPVTLLGMVSPIAIRLAITTPEEAGKVSGRIYAISTMGSFIGTFLPVLLLIPLLGTTITFISISVFLMLVALIGLGISQGWGKALVWLWMPVLLALFALLWARGTFKATPGQVVERESAYNYIEVIEQDGYTMLRLNDGQGVHSMYHPEVLDYAGPWQQFLAGPFFYPDTGLEDVERIAIIGLAAGTTARQATQVFGPLPIDGYEIDPEIIAVGEEYFGMDLPNLNAYAQDGRWGLFTSEEEYTLVAIDAYRPPYIPWHLTTQQFFQLVGEHLTDQGVVVINVGRSPNSRALIDAMVTTLQTVFPSVHVMDIPYTLNTMVYATVQPTTIDDLLSNYVVLRGDPAVHPLLLHAIEQTILFQQPLPEPTIVFTDDKAPVDWVINRMVLEFMLTGELEVLR
ncbi:MAG: fused MFS/spermidine synthase [Anaerolineales bacterium]|nr:fused MFS/spermidine synthase [Anaerolineales bacterium]